jgi:hypothetical protein
LKPTYIKCAHTDVYMTEGALERVDFMDIDISEDGEHWYHLIGGYCIHGYERLELKVR